MKKKIIPINWHLYLKFVASLDVISEIVYSFQSNEVYVCKIMAIFSLPERIWSGWISFWLPLNSDFEAALRRLRPSHLSLSFNIQNKIKRAMYPDAKSGAWIQLSFSVLSSIGSVRRTISSRLKLIQNQSEQKINNIKCCSPSTSNRMQSNSINEKKIEILVERRGSQWACERTTERLSRQNKTQNNEKETAKFAWPNECNNKITLSQISFLFVVFGHADKIASASPLCFRYSTDESFSQFLSTERIEPNRERECSRIKMLHNLRISQPSYKKILIAIGDAGAGAYLAVEACVQLGICTSTAM